MATTNLNIRIDNDTKNQFNDFCNDIGMSMSTAFNIFVKATLKERRIPFEIKESDPFYSKVNQDVLEKSYNDYKNDKMNAHDLIEV